MAFEVVGEDKNIIHEGGAIIVQKATQGMINVGLKGSWSVTKSKRKYEGLEQSISTGKRRFPLITFFDT